MRAFTPEVGVRAWARYGEPITSYAGLPDVVLIREICSLNLMAHQQKNACGRGKQSIGRIFTTSGDRYPPKQIYKCTASENDLISNGRAKGQSSSVRSHDNLPTREFPLCRICSC